MKGEENMGGKEKKIKKINWNVYVVEVDFFLQLQVLNFFLFLYMFFFFI